jgi:hypothetical protein
LALTLWFILDNKKAAIMVVDGDRVYSVSDVIKPRNSGGLNEDCAEEEDDEYDTNSSSRSSGVSKRMI